jgi:hypothetical protein
VAASGPEAVAKPAAAAADTAEVAEASAEGGAVVAADGGEDSVQVSADDTVSSENGTTYTDENGIVYDIVVVPCMNGTYGYPDPVFGIMDLPCKPCGSYMTTMDQNPDYVYNETDPVVNVNFDACVTYPGYGKQFHRCL